MKKILFMTSLLWLFPICADADIIYLKDGTKVRTSKVWEEGDVIRFSLEDYEDIIITYSKEIVERIEKGEGKSANKPTKQKDKISVAPKNVTASETGTPKGTAAKNKKPAALADSSERDPEPARIGQPLKTEKANVAAQPPTKKPLKTTGPKTVQVDGILFYNPRRAYKYWTGPTTRHRHHTLKEALAALAKQFDRDPQWIANNLGKTNNLGDIYRNLSPGGKIAPSRITPVVKPKGILFYDPRRPYKFWTGATAKHRTLNEALAALAQQYDRPPEWVTAHMGQSNDLGEIHENLMQSKAKEAK